MAYADGFLLALPKKNLTAYRKMAQKAGKLWKEHGALEYRECVAEDMKAQGLLQFPKVIKAKKGETVVFAWIVYKNRAHRDRVNKKVMSDERMNMGMDDMPFDLKRMAYGGFEVIVDE